MSISVSLVWDDGLDYALHSLPTGQVYPAAGSPSWSLGAVLFALDGYDPPITFTETINVGWLKQGAQVAGRIREKDVEHLQANGRILVSRLLYRGGDRVNDSYGNRQGTIVRLNGLWNTRDYLVSTMAPWGTDIESVQTLSFPRYYVGGYQKEWCEPFAFEVTIRVKFHGDFASVICHQEPYQRVFTSDITGFSRTVSSSAFNYCTFYYRYGNWDNGRLKVWNSPTYSKNSTSSFAEFNFPLKSVEWEDVVPSAIAEYGIPFNGVTDPLKEVPYREIGSEDAHSTWRSIIDSIRGGHLASFAWEQFQASPPIFDDGQLGSDILHQQDYVDFNALLSVYDLAGLLSGDFRDMLKFAKDGYQSWWRLYRSSKTYYGKLRGNALRSYKKFLKTTAGNNLAISYAILPTYDEMLSLIKNHDMLCRLTYEKSIFHARRTTVESGPYGTSIHSTHTCKAEVDRLPREIDSILKDPLGSLMLGIEWWHRWRLWPEFDTLYQGTPFTFLIDRQINIGDAAVAFDDNVRLEYFPVRNVVRGTKRRFSLSSQRAWPLYRGTTGGINFVWYQRYSTRDLPLASISAEIEESAASKFVDSETMALAIRHIR